MVIRKLRKEDITSLSELLKESFNEVTIDPSGLEKLVSSQNVVSIIAFDQVVIGNIIITLKLDYVKNKKIYCLDYVCVKEEYRNRGIASALLDVVEKMAIKNQVSCITFTSNPSRIAAHHFYLNHGYTIRDTNVFYKNI